MSVLRCSREGCPNAMCQRYSDTYGYICDECFEELAARLASNLDMSIDGFMASQKMPNNDCWLKIGIRYARMIFPLCHEEERNH